MAFSKLFTIFVLVSYHLVLARDVSAENSHAEKAVGLNGRGGYNKPRPPVQESDVSLDGRGGYNKPRPPVQKNDISLDGRGGYNKPRPPVQESDVSFDGGGHGGHWPPQELKGDANVNGRGGYNKPKPPAENVVEADKSVNVYNHGGKHNNVPNP